MKIVLDARATTPHFPGVGRATLGLLDGLAQIEHDHAIVVLAHADAPPATLRAFNDPRLRRIVAGAAPLGLAQQWRGPRLARALHADLWHAPYYVRPFWAVPRPVVTVYDVIGHVVPGALPSLRARLLFEASLRLSLRSAAHVIASSEATQHDLLATYRIAQHEITVIPLAVDAHFQPQSAAAVATIRVRYDLPERYLLYVGSNKPHKNLPLLVAAFAAVASDATLVIAGRWDARYPQAQQAAAKLDLGARVRFVHDVADHDLPALLAGALAFAFPSRYEGFGLPPLEAMACGTPVIAAATSSLPEVVGDAGLLVAPTAAALRDALQRILDDAALRDTLRERGLARARRFAWPRTAQMTVEVWQRVGAAGYEA